MAPQGDTVAYSGSPPGQYPRSNIFDFLFGNPFQELSDHVPPSQRLPPIEESKPIFVDNKTDRTLTLGQMKKDALTVAANLQNLGLDPDQVHALPPTPTCQRPEVAPVVVIQLPNCLAFAPVLLGVFASGLTASLVSPALTASELSWVLQNAQPQAIVTAKACLGAMHEAIQSQKDRDFFSKVPVFTVDVAHDTYPSLSTGAKTTTTTQDRDWTALLATPSAPVQPYHLDASSALNRTAVILWSSGTSGRSKGVLLSHNALVFATASIWHGADYNKPGLEQRWLGYVPFYHVFGLCNIFLIAPCTGATCYVMTSFNLDTMLSSTANRKITYLQMAPPVAVMLAKSAAVEPYAKSGTFKSVVGGITGGAPLGHEVVAEVHKRLGFNIRMGYGLSETCNTSSQRGLAEADMRAGEGDSGLPNWGVELLIAADGQDFRSRPATKARRIDEAGEILVRSPGVTSAYLPIGGLGGAGARDMSITAEALTPDGWFRTGDVGYLDARGHIHITDRLKELIKVRAYQVAPAELEAVLDSSEAVADAGVVGIHDDSEATEWPRAFVVPRDLELIRNRDRKGLERLAAELKTLVEKRTAKYKWIMGGFVFVDAIPKSPSGKILRRVMKDGGVKGIEVAVYTRKKRDVKL